MKTLYLFLRHYISDFVSMQEFERIVSTVIRLTKRKDTQISLIINTNKTYIQNHKTRVMKALQQLLEHDVPFSLAPGLGAGHAFLDIIEESLSTESLQNKPDTIFLLDGDQYDLLQRGVLTSLRRLQDMVLDTDSIIGLGQRDDVTLASTKELQTYREIEEMIHALYVKSVIKKKTPNSSKKVPPAYKELIDVVPGCYCINIRHPRFFRFLATVQQDLLHANLNRFAGDPYLVCTASTFGTLCASPIKTHKNGEPAFNVQTITKKHENIAKTHIAPSYHQLLRSRKAKSALSTFYNTADIKTVLNLAQKGFTK